MNKKKKEKNSPKSGKRIFQEINRNTLSKLNVVQHQYRATENMYVLSVLVRCAFIFMQNFSFAISFISCRMCSGFFFCARLYCECMWWCASVLHFLVLLARIMCRWWYDCFSCYCTWASCLAKCMCYHLPPEKPNRFLHLRSHILCFLFLFFLSHCVCRSAFSSKAQWCKRSPGICVFHQCDECSRMSASQSQRQ